MFLATTLCAVILALCNLPARFRGGLISIPGHSTWDFW